MYNPIDKTNIPIQMFEIPCIRLQFTSKHNRVPVTSVLVFNENPERIVVNPKRQRIQPEFMFRINFSIIGLLIQH